jgi:hypothetical protein
MRCMACGAEMHVVQVVPDDTMMVPGYEHHTLQCSGCSDTERRLVFNREAAERAAAAETESVPVVPPPEAVPTTNTDERVAPPSAWQRAVAMFRGRHA